MISGQESPIYKLKLSKNMLKKYLSEHFGGIAMVAGIILLAGVIFYQQSPLNVKGAGGPFNNVKQYLTVNADPYMNHSTASTTQTNLAYIGTATTSYAFATDSVDQVDFNLLGASATTTSLTLFGATYDVPTSNSALDLAYCYDYSDDQISWFAPTSNCGYWKPITSATSTRNVPVTNVNSKYMRIGFSSPMSTSTRFGLWGQAILKKGF